ncbi:MAG: CTP synthase [Elusimicrobia bacterium]|nr:CTP synthase [Elusimicrobiota bacterium]MBU2614153.1 CTP synthase [Elusimicrobiota bacterium]
MKQTKFIFVTGGVVSSLGKGITASSLGTVLKNCGLKVNMLKIDPYLNVDPGTMSPFQHGEVFVTEDGAETDLDLGNYERYLDVNFSQENNITSGAIYDTIITKERRGDFLGATVQVIPHVTNEIIDRIWKLSENNKCDVVIIEIGGTTGDIEGLPFLEAARQFALQVGRQHVCFIHVTLIPYIRAAEELKTKPTQQSVAKLREIGIEPHILICRTEKPLNDELKAKIALFCNVRKDCVIEEMDVETSIYEVPLTFKAANLERIISYILGLEMKTCDLSAWEKILDTIKNAQDQVTIAIAGKYTNLKDAYKSICESLAHAGIANNTKVKIKYVNVECKNIEEELNGVNGILIPGGFGDRGIEGKINVVKYARENKVPFFGLCLGMQCAVIEYARNVCHMKDANSTEFNPKTRHPVIHLLAEQKDVSHKGGTMRLGAYPCKIDKKSPLAYKAYKKELVFERHRHRYEFNNKYRTELTKKGLSIAGQYQKKNLVEIIELKDHPWFVAVQFHPEFKSRPTNAHPLFRDFVKAALEQAR